MFLVRTGFDDIIKQLSQEMYYDLSCFVETKY